MTDKRLLQELQEIKHAALLAAKPILTTDEAATFMGVTKCNLYKLVHEKRIPYYKSAGGKFTYFKRTELEQWLTAVRVSTDDELKEKTLNAPRKVSEVDPTFNERAREDVTLVLMLQHRGLSAQRISTILGMSQEKVRTIIKDFII